MSSAPRRYTAPAPTPVPAPAPAAAPAPVASLPAVALSPVTWQRVTRVELGSAPLLVWIGEGTGADEIALERVAFGVPKTNLGSHAFRRLRISAADAARDPRVSAWAGLAGPTLVVMSADGAKTTALGAGSLVPRPVWVAMKEVTAATFNDDLEVVVASARLNLEETERLEAQRRELAGTTLTETDRQVRLAAITRRLTELSSELLSLWTLHPRKAA